MHETNSAHIGQLLSLAPEPNFYRSLSERSVSLHSLLPQVVGISLENVDQISSFWGTFKSTVIVSSASVYVARPSPGSRPHLRLEVVRPTLGTVCALTDVSAYLLGKLRVSDK